MARSLTGLSASWPRRTIYKNPFVFNLQVDVKLSSPQTSIIDNITPSNNPYKRASMAALAAENPAGLISTSAVQSGGKSYLFYSRPNGELAFLRSVVSSESSSGSETVPKYTTGNIIADENVVVANTKSPQIAAVAYSIHGQDQIRVYYVSSQGWLQELCKSGSGSWTHGSLNNSSIQASPKSLLTASVDNYGQGQLKLYYNRDNDSMMWCTWVNMGTQDWSTRKINDKY